MSASTPQGVPTDALFADPGVEPPAVQLPASSISKFRSVVAQGSDGASGASVGSGPAELAIDLKDRAINRAIPEETSLRRLGDWLNPLPELLGSADGDSILTKSMWDLPVHIAKKAGVSVSDEAVVTLPNTEAGGRLLAAMNFGDVGYVGDHGGRIDIEAVRGLGASEAFVRGYDDARKQDATGNLIAIAQALFAGAGVVARGGVNRSTAPYAGTPQLSKPRADLSRIGKPAIDVQARSITPNTPPTNTPAATTPQPAPVTSAPTAIPPTETPPTATPPAATVPPTPRAVAPTTPPAAPVQATAPNVEAPNANAFITGPGTLPVDDTPGADAPAPGPVTDTTAPQPLARTGQPQASQPTNQTSQQSGASGAGNARNGGDGQQDWTIESRANPGIASRSDYPFVASARSFGGGRAIPPDIATARLVIANVMSSLNAPLKFNRQLTEVESRTATALADQFGISQIEGDTIVRAHGIGSELGPTMDFLSQLKNRRTLAPRMTDGASLVLTALLPRGEVEAYATEGLEPWVAADRVKGSIEDRAELYNILVPETAARLGIGANRLAEKVERQLERTDGLRPDEKHMVARRTLAEYLSHWNQLYPNPTAVHGPLPRDMLGPLRAMLDLAVQGEDPEASLLTVFGSDVSANMLGWLSAQVDLVGNRPAIPGLTLEDVQHLFETMNDDPVRSAIDRATFGSQMSNATGARATSASGSRIEEALANGEVVLLRTRPGDEARLLDGNDATNAYVGDGSAAMFIVPNGPDGWSAYTAPGADDAGGVKPAFDLRRANEPDWTPVPTGTPEELRPGDTIRFALEGDEDLIFRMPPWPF